MQQDCSGISRFTVAVQRINYECGISESTRTVFGLGSSKVAEFKPLMVMEFTIKDMIAFKKD